MLTDGGLAKVHLRRGFGEAAVLEDRDEDLEAMEIHLLNPHKPIIQRRLDHFSLKN